MSCQHQDEYFLTPYGQRLYCQSYIPEEKPIGLIIIVHGFAEHSSHYRDFARFLADAQFVVCMYDARGHGLSEGGRGQLKDFQLYVEDMFAVSKHFKALHPHLPTFLFGHSMGGLVAIRGLQQDNSGMYKAACLSSPFIKMALEVPEWKRKASTTLSKFFPHLKFDSQLSGNKLCRDPQLAQQYDSDPLVLKKATASWVTEAFKAQKQAINNPQDITIPIFVSLPGNDMVVSTPATLKFCKQVGSELCKYEHYEDSYHEVLKDPELKQTAMETFLTWYRDHL